MKLDDFRKLKSMMDRTTSDNDHEALLSLRKANEILAKENLSWTRVLDRSVQIIEPFEEAQGNEGLDNDDLEELFDKALSNSKPGDFQTMLEDIYSKWKRFGSLSPKQRSVVERAASSYR